MPHKNRSGWRDTFVYAANNPEKALAGLWTAPGLMNDNLYSMVKICCDLPAIFALHHQQKDVPRNSHPVQFGNYYIVAEDKFLPCFYH